MSASHLTPTGFWLALVTPFLPDHSVDYTSLQKLAQHYQAQGVQGLVLCGSTGEGPSLDEDECLRIVQTVHDSVPPMPLVVGLSGYHLKNLQARLRQWEAAKLQVQGVLVSAPSYIRPSQKGLIAWFQTLADTSPAPVWLYDIPYRTGSTLQLETIRQLAQHPRIVAIKDCGGDARKTQALVQDGQLALLTGEDHQILPAMALGAAGVVSAAGHIHPERFAQLVHSLRHDDGPRSRQLWSQLLPWLDLAFSEPNPSVLKAALHQQGLVQDVLRPPMQTCSPATAEKVRQWLNHSQLMP
ncbi:4-hydroxy-tetrahydrodipicolinate synthase [Curvibacter sp. CHRR-16]|uniref:4-hydroxy-tetrahydrodipicolinate synthase n=1 Tax=Curvibacter sp. CHRR-16 TaxID=2835872 RepID=UPI001BDB52F5|nr:4-hydroxy-tetrahydrodipicolinate synthase [Curvibacter sp. CHRR-16]MBT0571141.1 4-hydroxy-tetrahydrodipicolinate synthase [Curvibacter sp. CHRR-16]